MCQDHSRKFVRPKLGNKPCNFTQKFKIKALVANRNQINR